MQSYPAALGPRLRHAVLAWPGRAAPEAPAAPHSVSPGRLHSSTRYKPGQLATWTRARKHKTKQSAKSAQNMENNSTRILNKFS